MNPHEEKIVTCKDCGAKYCKVCRENCHKCGSVHIKHRVRILKEFV